MATELPEDRLIKIAYIYRGLIKHHERLEKIMANVQGYISLIGDEEEKLERLLTEARN